MSYDETLSDLEMQMLLLNIARTHAELPHHFTITSNIAASFAYQANAGFSGTINETAPGVNTYGVTLGASALENPTLNIVPMQGEEFTTRILTPMDESKFLFFVLQDAPLEMIMRLMAQGIELQNPQGEFQRFILNWPGHKDYKEFRDLASKLARLQEERKLFVQRVYFEETVRAKLAQPPSPAELTDALEKGFRWRPLATENDYELGNPTIGRVIITNYDPRTLTNAKRQALNARAAMNPNNFVFLDIASGYPGGSLPLLGALKLRSFNVILDFVSSGMNAIAYGSKEVGAKSATATDHPDRVLNIVIDAPSPAGTPRVIYRGHTYGVLDTPWDRLAFRLLYQLFQITVEKVTGVGTPVITISK